ncbi:unnamed protein product, partial [Prorocentrum cordatum]
GYDEHKGIDFADGELDFHGVVWTLNKESETHYLGHERTRLDNGEIGDRWAKQQAAKASCFGYNTEEMMRREPLEVSGVGKGPDYCHQQWRLPIGTQEISQESEGGGSLGSYTAPIIPDSDVPAPLGNRALKQLNAIMECGLGILHLCGPARRELATPAGTRSYNLKASRSGHWPLPCSKFEEVAATKPTGCPIDELHPKPEQLDFVMVESESETKPKDEEKQDPTVTGYGVAPGSSR